jgi:hypothetical protein
LRCSSAPARLGEETLAGDWPQLQRVRLDDFEMLVPICGGSRRRKASWRAEKLSDQIIDLAALLDNVVTLEIASK